MKGPMTKTTLTITADTITDNEICDVAEEVRRLVVTALGEDEGGGLPPSHPLVKKAKRKLAAIAEILNARAKEAK